MSLLGVEATIFNQKLQLHHLVTDPNTILQQNWKKILHIAQKLNQQLGENNLG
jgi:uncharacterized protein YbcV (DUF1398 family)